MTAEQQHCSVGESPKLLYTTDGENCSSWMHLLNYNPHQGFQHSFPHHLNRNLLIFSENEIGKRWLKNFSLENLILKFMFRTCIFWLFQIQPDKCSVLPNSKYAHESGSGRQGEIKRRIRSCQHYATATLDTLLLQVYSPVWLSPKASRRRIFCPKHTEGKQKCHNIRIKVRYEQALNA